MRVRPQFEEALRTAREIKAHAPHCRAIVTVYEMKRLGRDAAGLTAFAGPLPGIYEPAGPGKLLFAFFVAIAETERENIRESTLEGVGTADGRRSSPTTCCTPCCDAGRSASTPNARRPPAVEAALQAGELPSPRKARGFPFQC
ncbi:hypothetical protein GCM10010191_02430 [Actinomadura vinacea]|uniref:Resolvase/invertase-type recombinase catalytic domain-containing protein n=1 Tax=Actinomadura vinacea TaxID=115336 RepID=A0ABN3IA74_9ACTN